MLKDDGRKLLKDFGIRASSLIELGALALQADPLTSQSIEDGRTGRGIVALQAIVQRYLGKHLNKGSVRVQNWDKADLTEEMKDCNPIYSSVITI